MRKQMFELSIELTDDGDVALTQPAGMDEPSVIIIAPEQVDIVIEWLNEAKAKAVAKGLVSGITGSTNG